MNNTYCDKPIFKAVAAMSRNRVIGNNGQLPWHLSDDLKYFKKLTLGSTVIMGRKTFDSIGKPLPNRKNIVISRNPKTIDKVEFYQSVDQLLDAYKNSTESLFIIGGAQIYATLLKWTKEIYLTYIYKEYPGDTHFPEIDSDFVLNNIELQTNEFEVRKFVREPKPN